MAFTGTAVVTQVSDRIVRITGLSLASAAAGTVGLAGATGSAPGVTLPASFQTLHYTYNNAVVPFASCLDVSVVVAAVGVATAIPVAIVKTGTTVADFRVTLTNTHGSLASPALEIYIKLHE